MFYMILTNSQKNRQILRQYIVIYNILKYNRIMVIMYENTENMGLQQVMIGAIKDQKTIDYYNTHAKDFAQSTTDLDFHEVQDRFLTKLPLGARILDFGCGAGRDAKYFAEKGFEVVATDGSEELCKIANRLTGVVAKRMFFSELDETDSYDGIWACASILHLRKEELMDVIPRMIRAVKTDGYLYMSFKYGTFEGYRGERYFTNFTEKSFEEFIKPFSNVTIIEQWISSDVRPGRGEEKWLNLILQKRTIN